MVVRIEPGADRKLQLTGDIGTVLDVPERAIHEGFSPAFSDGTLVHGRYPESASACRFTLSTEGAALVRITREGMHDVLQLTLDIVVEEAA